MGRYVDVLINEYIMPLCSKAYICVRHVALFLKICRYCVSFPGPLLSLKSIIELWPFTRFYICIYRLFVNRFIGVFDVILCQQVYKLENSQNCVKCLNDLLHDVIYFNYCLHLILIWITYVFLINPFRRRRLWKHLFKANNFFL